MPAVQRAPPSMAMTLPLSLSLLVAWCRAAHGLDCDAVPGAYCVDTSGETAACPRGQYSSGGSVYSCELCVPGRYGSSDGAPSCDMCPAGQYIDSYAALECVICPAGRFARAPGGAASCTPCYTAPGYVCFPGSTTAAGRPCSAGTYTSTYASSECLKCPAGRFSGTPGSYSCAVCTAGPGRYCGEGSVVSSGLPCPAGRYTITSGEVQCQECPVGRYASGEGNTGCGECPVLPVGWVCSQGSTTPEGTLCGAGKYADAAKGCAPCDNNECAFSVRVTFNATLTFVPSVDACLPEAAVTPLLLEQHIRSAAAYTPANLEVVVLVGEPQCPSPSSPVTQFLNFTVTLKGLPYPMAANTLLQAVPRDVVCQSVKGALVTSVAECVSPINVTTVTIFTSGSLVVVPPLTTNFDGSLVLPGVVVPLAVLAALIGACMARWWWRHRLAARALLRTLNPDFKSPKELHRERAMLAMQSPSSTLVTFAPEPLSVVRLDGVPEGNPNSFLPRRVSPYKAGVVAPAPAFEDHCPSPVVFDTEGSISKPSTP